MQEKNPTQTSEPNTLNPLFGTLKKLSAANEMALVYSNTENTEVFSVGYIQALTEREILIAQFTPHGKYDGYLIKLVENIYRVEYGGPYAAMLKKLSTLAGDTHDDFEIHQESLLADLLFYACHEKKVVSLELLESGIYDVIGFVLSSDKETIQIALLDAYGAKDGICLIKMEDISKMLCDSEREVALGLLAGVENFFDADEEDA